MNKERPDELDAKSIVEIVLGIELEHADKDGGVDYLSTDGRHAVEITRVTDGRKRAGSKALDTSRAAENLEGELQTCWWAFVSDTQVGLKTFLQQVHPALVELEAAGEDQFDRAQAAMHVMRQGPLSSIYRSLLDAGVERASAVPNHAHRRCTHSVIPGLISGGTSSGSDRAVFLLTDLLSVKEDNPRKLRASGRDHRHLFVWLDDDTRFDVARPLSRAAPSWHDGFGVPATPPMLAQAISHLWVMHEGSRLGWIWNGEAWCEISAPPRLDTNGSC